jgi:hypothetical protein
MVRAKKPANKHRCIFHDGLTKEVDDRIQLEWKQRHGASAPFGSMRQSWQQLHCATVNPHGSDGCTYRTEDCLLAYWAAAQTAMSRPGVDDRRVYFRGIAKRMGLVRAEDKPKEHADGSLERLTRALAGDRGPGLIEALGDEPGAARRHDVPEVDVEEPGRLPRPVTRPTAIGDLLRTPDRGARPGPAEDGEEGIF